VPPQEETMPIPSTASSPTTLPTSTTETTEPLPSNATIGYRRLSLLEPLFRTQLKVNRIDELYATTRGKIRNLSVVSNCDLDMLKVFVTTNWAPIVLLISPVGGRHLWAVTGYDDAAKQIQLRNPANRSTRYLVYSDFEEEWRRGSAQKCVLVTPVKVNKAKIHSLLEKYLSSTKVSHVVVRSR